MQPKFKVGDVVRMIDSQEHPHTECVGRYYVVSEAMILKVTNYAIYNLEHADGPFWEDELEEVDPLILAIEQALSASRTARKEPSDQP